MARFFELQTASDRDTLTLLVRGAAMPQHARLMVFETSPKSCPPAQRLWSEVARRLAMKSRTRYSDQLSPSACSKTEHKLEGTDQAMLVRSVVHRAQVQAMKTLVNEFSRLRASAGGSSARSTLNGLVRSAAALRVIARSRRAALRPRERPARHHRRQHALDRSSTTSCRLARRRGDPRTAR